MKEADPLDERFWIGDGHVHFGPDNVGDKVLDSLVRPYQQLFDQV